MITIRLDFSRRLFVLYADSQAMASFKTYAGAAGLWKECRAEVVRAERRAA